jgi:hypothetical protein
MQLTIMENKAAICNKGIISKYSRIPVRAFCPKPAGWDGSPAGFSGFVFKFGRIS